MAGRAGGARRASSFPRPAPVARARDARTLRRGAVDHRGTCERRSWSAAAASRSRSSARPPSTSSSWPAILRPPPSPARKQCGCTASWASRVSPRRRPGGSARALYELDRLDDAEAWAARAAELGASDDTMTQMLWRQVKAKVLARRGEHAEAEQLAREAVAIGEDTDQLNSVGRRLRRPRRGARARRPRRRGGRGIRRGGRVLRAQGQPGLGATRADATRRAPGGAGPMSGLAVPS